MLCKICNTRIGPGGTACPNCGSHSLSKATSAESRETAQLPLLGRSRESAEPPAEANDAAAAPESPEVELDEPTEVELNEPAEVGTSAASPPGAAVSEEKEESPAVAPAAVVRRSQPLGTPDPIGLRAMLAEQPELLEPGLMAYKNEKGTPLGAGYTSAVGEIDLLARDADDGFVVVMVADPNVGASLVSEVLQRVGWVRKHLGGGSKPVRAIVLLDRVRDEIAYAASAVADTVSFKTYRVALTFDDVEF